MSSRTSVAAPKPDEPRYLSWRGELIAEFALTRAGLVVRDAPVKPFDLLASTPDGLFFLVEVRAYSSMHGGRTPVRPQADGRRQYRIDTSFMRAVSEANLPVVLFIVDADTEAGHYIRLDRLPHPSSGQRTVTVPLAVDNDLSPKALNALVSELREDLAVSRRPA